MVKEKKTKDQIAKAAGQKKKGVKKWTKGKVKEKVNNAVFLDKAGYDKIIADIPKQSKVITIATVIEKFKIGGSIARVILKTLIQNGSLRRVDPHSKQFICVSTAAPKKVEAAETTKGGKPVKQQKAKKGEEATA
jgi:small subunit ribosomal protein S25e